MRFVTGGIHRIAGKGFYHQQSLVLLFQRPWCRSLLRLQVDTNCESPGKGKISLSWFKLKAENVPRHWLKICRNGMSWQVSNWQCERTANAANCFT